MVGICDLMPSWGDSCSEDRRESIAKSKTLFKLDKAACYKEDLIELIIFPKQHIILVKLDALEKRSQTPKLVLMSLVIKEIAKEAHLQLSRLHDRWLQYLSELLIGKDTKNRILCCDDSRQPWLAIQNAKLPE